MTIDITTHYQLLKTRCNRARLTKTDNADFLYQEAAHILSQRLEATNREFTRPILLFDNPHSQQVTHLLSQAVNKIKTPFKVLSWPKLINEMEILDLEAESADLIISVFDLARVKDLPSIFAQINLALKADGLFLACFPHDGSLSQLNTALLSVESSLSNGAASRVSQFFSATILGNLLLQNQFKLVVTDLEERTIRYSSLNGILRDLRANAATSLTLKNAPNLPKAALSNLANLLKSQFADEDGKIPITFNMAFISGWKEDKSQQQPLRPGSAKNSLKDFL